MTTDLEQSSPRSSQMSTQLRDDVTRLRQQHQQFTMDQQLESHQKSLRRFLNQRSDRGSEPPQLSPYKSIVEKVAPSCREFNNPSAGVGQDEDEVTLKKRERRDLLMKDYCSRSLS